MNKYQKELSKLVKWDIKFQEKFYPYRVKSYCVHKKIVKHSFEWLKGRHSINDDIESIRGLRSYIQCAFTNESGKLEN